MPYIDPKRRAELAAFPVPLIIETPGELNYLITRLCIAYVRQVRPPTYTIINEVLGALAGATLEFYRRLAVPYEDAKIEQNGDVYPR